MGMQTKLNLAGSVAGVPVRESIALDADLAAAGLPTLPAAKSGTLTTRTDADTGEVTCGAGHGFLTADVLDVYWDGGVHYGATATVAGNVVSLDGGDGDDLPAQDTAVTLAKRVTISDSIPGAALRSLLASASRRGHVIFATAADAEVCAGTIGPGVPLLWWFGAPHANPLGASTVGKLHVTNGSSAGSSTFRYAATFSNS